ncbi:flavin-containing monooxygenase [Tardiphaga sp.]|jgi:4-hydroxyacetophenone monooxygenase|uniref:flavin-containing monooxygenase n=1 Tax=Tardiphaga sp. TaxID=1926292 RepID=UPI0037D9CB62
MIAAAKQNQQAGPQADVGGLFTGALALDGDDAAIEAALADAELPSLLAALSSIYDDPGLAPRDLVPPTPPMAVTIAPQGGMSAEQQARARHIAKSALIAARDRGWPSGVPHRESLEAAIDYMTGGAGAAMAPLLLRELGLPSDERRPKWRKSDLAPERAFSVLVIGAGLSGIAAAFRLSQAEIPFVVLEKNPEVGGVWWNNTYPGCRLDTPNFAYSFSFAAKADWPQQFSQRSEILNYAKEVVARGDLRPNIKFSTEVESMIFDEEAGLWVVKAREGDAEREYRANVVITAAGHLNRPIIPAYEGTDDYKGRLFHSGQWESDVDLAGKRVAVIGTGASAFQIVPSVVDHVKSLKVFQRNPAWMLPTPNYHSDIKPGMRWLLDRVPFYGNWFRLWQYWIAAEGRRPAVQIDRSWTHPISVSRLNEEIRVGCIESLKAQVGDRVDLLEQLTPAYAPGTKRMVRDNGAYVSALKRPHSKLVTERIERFVADGIETVDGQKHELDVVIWATGYKATEYLAPIEVRGLGGELLHDRWKDECSAYLGISIPGFPNLFQLGGPNSGTVVNGNAINSMECALEFAIHAIEFMLLNETEQVDVRQEVLTEFVSSVDAANRECAWGDSRVDTWYRSKTGRAIVPWPFSVLDYFQRTATFRSEEYIITPAKA